MALNTSLNTKTTGKVGQTSAAQSASALDMSGGSNVAKITTAQVKQQLGLSGGNLGIGKMSQEQRQGLLSGAAPTTANTKLSTQLGSSSAYQSLQKPAAPSPTSMVNTIVGMAGAMQKDKGVSTSLPTTPLGTTTGTTAGTTTGTTTGTTAGTTAGTTVSPITGTFNKVGSTTAKFGVNDAGKVYNTKTGAVKNNWNTAFDESGNLTSVTKAGGKSLFQENADGTGLLKGKFDYLPNIPQTDTGAVETPKEEEVPEGYFTQEDLDAYLQDNLSKYLDPLNEQISSLTSQLTQQDDTSGVDVDPNLNSQVDFNTETIQGQIQNLLALDGNGRFANPVIQQAAEAAQMLFAERGLLNSSSANQAMLEAAISKAVEIAGQDAQTYFQNRTNNVDWTNKLAQGTQNNAYAKGIMGLEQKYKTQNLDSERAFTMQQNYLTSVQNIDKMYQTQVMALQSSQLDPASKQQALNDLAINRDNSIRLTTKSFETMPQWEDEWSQMLTVQLPSYQSNKPDAAVLSGNFAQADDYAILNAIQWGAMNEDEMDDNTFNALIAEADRRKLRR